MHATMTFVVAVAPAFVFGWLLPSLFVLFGSDIQAPLNKQTSVLSTLTLPWLLGTGMWMYWIFGISDDGWVYRVPLSATSVSCLGTVTRQKVLPVVRTLIHMFADWLHRATV